MFDAIATVLSWFYSLWPSYGMSIVMLTLAVMVAVLPLTLKGTRSMIAMQKLQPEMRRIQKEYKDDRQQMNEELLKFYKANNINPLGGCLPLLVQMPVFIVLYRVLHELTKRGPDGTFDPGYLDKSSELYRSLDGSTEMVSWGIDLSRSASSALQDSFVTALPYLVMIVVVVVSQYVQQLQISARNPGMEMPAQQKILLRVLPAFMAVFCFTIPASLVVYFVVSNCFRIAQNAYITRAMYRKDAAAADGTEPGSTGSTVTKAKPGPAKSSNAKSSGRGRSTSKADDAGSAGTAKKTGPPAKRSGGGRVTPPKAKPVDRTGPNGASSQSEEADGGSKPRRRKRY